jgi:hypothetical protein
MTTMLLIAAISIGLCLGIARLFLVWLGRRVRVALEDSKLHEELFADFNQMESDFAASALEFKNAKRDFRQALKKQRPPKSKLTTRSISKTQTVPTPQSSTLTNPTSIEPTSIPNPKRKRGISTPLKLQTHTPTLQLDTPVVTGLSTRKIGDSPPQQIIPVNPCPSVVESNPQPNFSLATRCLFAIIHPFAAISRWCINFITRRKPPASALQSNLRKAA